MILSIHYWCSEADRADGTGMFRLDNVSDPLRCGDDGLCSFCPLISDESHMKPVPLSQLHIQGQLPLSINILVIQLADIMFNYLHCCLSETRLVV